jgi:hypothetical protein
MLTGEGTNRAGMGFQLYCHGPGRNVTLLHSQFETLSNTLGGV